MPYSDLSDAWNSYDPRYLRVSDPQLPAPQADPQDEADRRFDQRMDFLNRRANAYSDWTKQATIGEIQDAGPFGYPKFPSVPMWMPNLPRDEGYGYGYKEGDRMPFPASRQPGLDALFDENIATRGETPRDLPLSDALERSKEGMRPFDMPSDIFERSSRGILPGTPVSYNPGDNSWAEFDPRNRYQYESGSETQGQPTRPGYNHPTVLARLYKDIQRDLRLNPDQALGFLANLNAESFGFTLPQEVGPQIKGKNTGGLGWSQWTAGRRGEFENYLRQTGTAPTSYEGNYGFLTSELQRPEWQPFLDNLRRQKGAESSTRYTEQAYENPKRKTGRQDWLARTRSQLPASQRALADEEVPPNALANVPSSRQSMGFLGY